MAATLAALLPILLFTTWPLRPFLGHSHWGLVEWIPFTRKQAPLDFVLNALLFVPLGSALAWRAGHSGIWRAAAAGLVVSLMVESYQVYTHTAFPTMADVLANALGASMGAFLWRGRRRLSDRLRP